MAKNFIFQKMISGSLETLYPKTVADNVVRETPNGEKTLSTILDEKGAFKEYNSENADESAGNDLLFEILGDVIDSETMESIKGTIVSPVAPSDTKYLWIDTSTTPYVLKCYDINHNKWISVSIGGGIGNGYIMGDSEPSDYTVLWIDTSGGQYILKCHDSNDNTWKSITTNSSISQFRTYSELLEEFVKENPSLDVSEGSIVIVKESEMISNENKGEIIKYPSGLYRYNSKTTKWEHQDYLLRKEFQNHVKCIAKKDKLGHVIVGNGIEVKDDGTICIDWYSSSDNGDGTSSVTIGGVEYIKDNETGEIQGSTIGGVEIGSTTTIEPDGNTVKVETIGGTTITTTIAPDGTSTIVTDNNGAITTTKKDENGDIVSTVVGDVVVSGSVTETIPTETIVDENGNTIETTTTTTSTPNGQSQTTTTVITTPTGEKTETTETVTSSGSDVNIGFSAGEKTTVEKDSDGNVINTETETVLNKDGEDNLIHQEDLDNLFDSIDDLW